VAKTLLAVDDSVTMRKVLEITFSGEDFRVITADGSQSAMGKLSEQPQVFVVDTVLANEDGYALAKQLRQRNPNAPIIMLASRYSPYDQGRGRDAGADDWADKPFDTQQLIDKVRKAILAKEASGAGAQPAAAPSPIASTGPQQAFRAPPAPQTPPMGAAQQQPPPGMGIGRGTQPSLGGQVPRSGTLVFGEGGQAPPPRPGGPAPQPPIAAPAPQQAAPAPAHHAPAQSPVAAAVNGQLAGKLGELGLTREQADAVLALSRDVVERVVWEVVPHLAETMIKEEIARLTKE
jgi:CheY-like chemotaxis protein